MDLSTPQLAALVAIADLGTFEAAARHLHVTPSAVSQRIRALESAAGQVLVRRGTPCTPTAAGERLLAVARQTQLLLAEVQTTPTVVDLPLAVNADSLATWWRPVIGEVATWEDVTLRLHVEDQAFSSDLLRRGDVLAAVTSEPQAVQYARPMPLAPPVTMTTRSASGRTGGLLMGLLLRRPARRTSAGCHRGRGPRAPGPRRRSRWAGQ